MPTSIDDLPDALLICSGSHLVTLTLNFTKWRKPRLKRSWRFGIRNKRVGHAALEVFLLLNGYEINASVDEQETLIIEVASGKVSRIELGEWLSKHIVVRNELS